ncbi:hypothetical protein [Granulicella sibirica]|uniref:PIN domain-containing protein n=1 Tax=Granulicella sibirica TaxID=2479048 RepID=A0A4Q0T7B3_9BACT|nr:hypothetical protein [Granulicella sibirica]RXH57566.1 hypothetical protein GRAN_0876 [Granulicella sibirica]
MPDDELIRPFIDANVLFSATHKPENVFVRIWAMTGVVPTTSLHAITEVRNNIGEAAQRRRLESLLRWSVIVGDRPDDLIPPNTVLRAKDRPILSAAIGADCNYLLTSDKHDFAHLYKRTIKGVYIMYTMDFCYAFQYRLDLDMLAYNFSEATGW